MYGLGAMGQGIARLAVERTGLRVVGAADIDPTLAGHDVGDVLELGRTLGVRVEADAAHALHTTSALVVIHATTAGLRDVFPQLMDCIEAGRNVISTAEELVCPDANPEVGELAQKLDDAARANGVVVLGIGLNPGYIMDALPLMLSAPCVDLKRVHLRRIVDAARLWSPLPPRIGAGLDVVAFTKLARERTIGHVGLSQSLMLLAGAFGWQLDPQPAAHDLTEVKPGKLVRSVGSVVEILEPIIAHRRITTDSLTVEAGQVAGIRQIALGWVDRVEVLRLDLDMFIGAPYPQDEIEIDATPPVRLTIPGGLHDDMATIGIGLNTIGAVVERARTRPGLATVADLTPFHFRAYR